MTVGERPTAPTDMGLDPESTRQRRRTARRRAQRRRRIAIGVAAGVIGVMAIGAALAAGGGDIPPNVTVAGIDLGGANTAQARTRLQDRAREILGRRVRFTSPQDPSFSLAVDGAVLASAARIDEAISRARASRGPVGRALARIGLAGTKEIPLTFTLQDGAVDRLVEEAQKALGRPPMPATVAVDGAEIVTTPARAGVAIDRPALAMQLATLPAEIPINVHPARPAADDDDARRARDLAERVVGTPRTVTLGTASAALSEATLRDALRFPQRKGTIAVELDPDQLRSALLRPLDVAERSPRDARLEIRGERVVVVPAQAGRALDAPALGAAIVAHPEAGTVAAAIRTTKPSFTTTEARALRIRQKVSEFTTPYQCCQPRVTNIQRAAAILDGTIIPVDGRFSLNSALGERTAARGFVTAPMIAKGELVDAVGGGVSQVATTMYNAAFFAGLALEAHTPHEFYISRYPMGREATVSWRTPDLVFRNDWPAAILVSVRAASNGITVAFYSSKLGRRVETETGEPTNPTQPKTIERSNPDLPPGTRKVVQSSGPGGFSVSYTRKVYRGAKLLRDETFHWTYRPENQIVEVGPPSTTTEPSGATSTTGGGSTTTTRPPATGRSPGAGRPSGSSTTTAPATGGAVPPPPVP